MKNMKDSFKYEKGNAGCIIALLIVIILILISPPLMNLVLNILLLKWLFD